VPGTRLSGKRSPSPSARARHSGKSFFQFFCKRLRVMLPSNATFFFVCPYSPSVALGEDGLRGRWPSPSAGLPRVSCSFRHSGKATFPECNTRARLASPSARFFGTRGSAWHSGKIASPVVIVKYFSDFRFKKCFYAWFSLTLRTDGGRRLRDTVSPPGLHALTWLPPHISRNNVKQIYKRGRKYKSC
jgi:hypothetical protein